MAHSSDIRSKEVINLTDGRKLGTVMDIEFTYDGKIASLTLPGPFRFTDFVRGDRGGLVIPWDRVQLLGQDVILVKLESEDIRTV